MSTQTRRTFLKKTTLAVAVASVATKVKAEEKTSGGVEKSKLDGMDLRARRRAFSEQQPVLEREKCWEIHMLGTSAGSPPTVNNNHTSWVLQKPNGALYMFDAGEYCSWTAYNMGLNLKRLRHLFLSHPHADHCAGLPGLITTIAKMLWLKSPKKKYSLTVYTSAPKVVEASQAVITNGGKINWVKTEPLKMGEIYRDKDIIVEAIGNQHMPTYPDGSPQSYSFRIKIPAINKTIIFSGDIKSVDELAPFINDGGCDLLMVETGHHYADSICEVVATNYPNKVKDIMFMHHGINLREDEAFEKARADAAFGKPVIISHDRQSFKLSKSEADA